MKHAVTSYTGVCAVSHPTWVRGLKLLIAFRIFFITFVAPYVGAWIETREM